MWQNLFEQFEPEAAHRERAYRANGIRFVSRVQQAVQDETVSTDTSAVYAWYQETEELSVVPDADAGATTAIWTASVWRTANATAVSRTRKMVRRQTVIGFCVL